MKTSLASSQKNSIKLTNGNIVSLGVHRLAIGDCRDMELIARLVQKDPIKLILVDQPYGVAYVEGKESFNNHKVHKAIANDQIQGRDEYRNFTKEYLEVVKPYLAKKNSCYLFNSDKMLRPMLDGMEDAGFHFAQLIIWIKNQPVINRMEYLTQHELLAFGWENSGSHEFMKGKDKSVIFCPKPAKSDLHPTMKPISLLRRLILNSTRIDDVVYDCFGGSGSTLIAAEQTKRKCLMVELDLQYCQTIITRFEKLTGISAKLIS